VIRLPIAVFAFMVAPIVAAAPFQNGSFETGVACNNFNIPAGTIFTAGWTVSVGNIDWIGAPPGCGAWQASNGTNSLDLVGGFLAGVGGVTQTFDTVPGVTYQVQFDLGGNFGAPPVIKPLAVTINGVTTNFTFDTSGSSSLNMGWTTKTMTFVAASTSSTINFVSDVSAAGGTLNAGAALDNVRVTQLAATGAPIPLSWAQWVAAAAIALMAVVFFRRRKAGSPA
jgi:choice-of-anchor C domain-containing protein